MLFKKKKRLEEFKEQTTVEQATAVSNSMDDFMVPLQHVVNTIVEITNKRGVCIDDWSMKDLEVLIKAFDRMTIKS
jgi:hypothetical protein